MQPRHQCPSSPNDISLNAKILPTLTVSCYSAFSSSGILCPFFPSCPLNSNGYKWTEMDVCKWTNMVGVSGDYFHYWKENPCALQSLFKQFWQIANMLPTELLLLLKPSGWLSLQSYRILLMSKQKLGVAWVSKRAGYEMGGALTCPHF